MYSAGRSLGISVCQPPLQRYAAGVCFANSRAPCRKNARHKMSGVFTLFLGVPGMLRRRFIRDREGRRFSRCNRCRFLGLGRLRDFLFSESLCVG